MRCDHEFEYEKEWDENIHHEGETINVPVKCCKCGLAAEEVWIFSCYVNPDTGEEVQ